MATIGIAQFLRVLDGETERALWQNYWPGQFVDYHVFVPFSASAITASQAGIQETMTITAPAIPLVFNVAQAATSSAWLIEVSVYQFSITTADATPPTSKTLTGQFTGEVIGGGMTLETVTLELGSSLTPAGVVVPVRRLTSTLIGAPPKL